jgi:maleylpyruvate isomerase
MCSVGRMPFGRLDAICADLVPHTGTDPADFASIAAGAASGRTVLGNVRSVSDIDPSKALDRHVEMAARAHQRLLAALDELVDADRLDVTSPSLLPNWSKGHVITHLSNNAEGIVRMFDGAAEGRIDAMYPGGPAGRNADIEAGAARAARQQVDALRQSIWQLEGRWANSTWQGRGVMGSGAEVAITDLPLLRVREVEIHHIDLDCGTTFADLPADYLRLELGRMEMLWAARQPMGMTPLPAEALAAPPPQRLAWLLGRAAIDGLPAADVF